jgi:hypothetical protein
MVGAAAVRIRSEGKLGTDVGSLRKNPSRFIGTWIFQIVGPIELHGKEHASRLAT